MDFVGRNWELEALDRFYDQPEAGLMVLYGRRRVGKTRLLEKWRTDRQIPDVLFWTAATRAPQYELWEFSQALVSFDPRFGGTADEAFSFRDWTAALDQMDDLAAGNPDRRFVIIIDEFTNLLRGEPALPSLIQRAWDHHLSRRLNLRLVLAGSLVTAMHDAVLSQTAPLHGRANLTLRLRPLPYGTLPEVFPHWTAAERVAAYGTAGGIPAYLARLARGATFVAGLRDHALAPDGIFMTDPTLLLHERLNDTAVYESILSAIGSGHHGWGEMTQMARAPADNLGGYIKKLQDLELIQQRDPVLVAPGSRRGRYYIADPFLRFYYRFIMRHRSAIERGDLAGVDQAIQSDLRSFIGKYVFEDICREWVAAPGVAGKLGFLPEVVGGYWSQANTSGVRQGVDLDVVAASPREKRLLVGEAKWGEAALSRGTLRDLVERSRRMPQVASGEYAVRYAVFVRDDATPAAHALASEMEALVVPLSEMEADLIAAASQAAARGSQLSDDLQF